MNNTIMRKIQRFGRIRQLHTIISQETIKPSSPTPPHLKIHNLSLIDYFSPNLHIPFIFFYKNYNTNSDINILKKSLSQCLTQYYPFAGRLLTPSSPHVDCNDQGVEFLEASIDSRLDDFILKKEQDETFDQLIPNSLGCAINKTSPNMLEVQLNHFTCGGAAMAVSISHKVADGFTMVKFVDDWASITRGGSPTGVSFFSSSTNNIKINIPEFAPEVLESQQVKYATRKFVFPNSKLNELKNKINTMGTTPLNPTRVESLTSLLFKCAATAATTKSGSFKVSNLNQMANLRGKTIANFPKLAAGNLYAPVIARTVDSGGMELNEVIKSTRKEMVQIQGIRSVEEVGEKMANAWVTLLDNESQSYSITSVCRFPFEEVDYGWGKPVGAMLASGSVDGSFIVLMDALCGDDGIEASVKLEEEEMDIFLQDKELLAYAN